MRRAHSGRTPSPSSPCRPRRRRRRSPPISCRGEPHAAGARRPGCPAGTNLCGFAPGMTVLVYDDTGNVDAFTIAAVDDAAAQLTLTARPADSAGTIYKRGSNVVEARVHTLLPEGRRRVADISVDARRRFGERRCSGRRPRRRPRIRIRRRAAAADAHRRPAARRTARRHRRSERGPRRIRPARTARSGSTRRAACRWRACRRWRRTRRSRR